MGFQNLCDKLGGQLWQDSDFNGIIYHYTSSNGFLGIVNEQNPKLYFTQYDSLNDFKERQEIYDFIMSYCDKRKKNGIFFQDLYNKIKDLDFDDNFIITTKRNLGSKFDNKEVTDYTSKECYTYLCSFSLDPDSLPMWKMYGKSDYYDGYCLELDSEPFSSKNSFQQGFELSLHRVIYSEIEKNKLLDKLFQPIIKEYDELSDENKASIFNVFIKNFIYKYQFVFKNKAFEYENEVRAILNVDKKHKDKLQNISKRKYRKNKNMIIPYIEFEFDKQYLYGVLLPPMPRDDVAKNNLKDYLTDNRYEDVSIETSKIPIRL